MAYKIKPGVSKIQVCGQNMLVASRIVWKDLPRVRPISKLWSLCWVLLQPDRTDEEAIRTFATLFHKPEEDIRAHFGKIYQKMAEEGYLIKADPGESRNESSDSFIIEIPEDPHDAE